MARSRSISRRGRRARRRPRNAVRLARGSHTYGWLFGSPDRLAPMIEPLAPYTLIYDGDCPVCQHAAAWVVAHTDPRAVTVLPCQHPDRARRFPQVSEVECLAAVQLAAPDGAVYAGPDALAVTLRLTRSYAWLGRLLQLPGIRRAARPVYRAVSRNRRRLPRCVGGWSGFAGACAAHDAPGGSAACGGTETPETPDRQHQ